MAVTAGALRIPLISHSASAESLSDKRVYPTFLRVIPSDGQFAGGVAELFRSLNLSKVGTININDRFGRDFRDALFEACQLKRITLRSYFFDGRATGDELYEMIRRGLSLFIEERISVIFYSGITADLDRAMARAANDLNWIEGKLYIGQRDVLMEAFSVADENEKRVLRRFFHGTLHVSRGFDISNPSWRRLQEAWPTFSVDDVNPYLPASLTAIEGSNLTSPLLRLPEDFFRNTAVVPKLLAFAYDSVMAVGFASCGPAASNASLLDNLKRVKFNGTSGKVWFDSFLNRDASTAQYTLHNIVSDDDTQSPFGLETRDVATFHDSLWEFHSAIVFSDGSSTPPLDVVPPQSTVDTLPYGAKVFGWVEATIGMSICLWAMVHLHRERATQVFVNAQPMFMFLLILGCLVMVSSIVPLTIESDQACMLFPWLFVLGFVLILTSLIAKSTRVALLWFGGEGHFPQHDRLIKGKTLLFGIFAILSLTISILVAWQVVAPLELKLVTAKVDADGFPLASSLVCQISSNASIALLATLCALIVILILSTLAVSLWVRNAPDKFHEAKMTAVAGLVVFQLFFIGIPTVVVTWGSALPQFLVLSSLVFLISMTVLFTLFFPKVYHWRFTAWNLVPITSLDWSNQDGTNYGRPLVASEAPERARRASTGGKTGISVVDMIDQEKRARQTNRIRQSTETGCAPQTTMLDSTTAYRRSMTGSQRKSSGDLNLMKSSSSGVSWMNRYSLDGESSSPPAMALREVIEASTQNNEEEKHPENCDQPPTSTIKPILKRPQGGGDLLATLSKKKSPPGFFYDEASPVLSSPQPLTEGLVLTAQIPPPFQQVPGLSNIYPLVSPSTGGRKPQSPHSAGAQV